MDECLDALGNLSESIKKLLNEDATGNKFRDIKRQLEALAQEVAIQSSDAGTGTTPTTTTEPIGLIRSYRTPSVDVLSPLGCVYSFDSEGVSAIGRRPICRVASSSIVRDSKISQRYSQLKYRTDYSSTVKVARPSDLLPSQEWKPPGSSQRSCLDNIFTAPKLEPSPTSHNQYVQDPPSSPLSSISAHSSSSFVPPSSRDHHPKLKEVQLVITKVELPMGTLLKRNDGNAGPSGSINIKTVELNRDAKVKTEPLSSSRESDNDLTVPDTETDPIEEAGQEKMEEEFVGGDSGLESGGRTNDSICQTGVNVSSEITDSCDSIRSPSPSILDRTDTGNEQVSTNKSDTPPSLKLEEPEMEETSELLLVSEDETRVGTSPEAGNLVDGWENMSTEEHKPTSKDESEPEQNEELDNGNGFWLVVDEDTETTEGKERAQHLQQKTHLPAKAHLGERSGTRNHFPLMYSCCGCGRTIYRSVDMICFNQRLDVIVCESCFKTLTRGHFAKDTEGQEIYCSMCGDGGSLVLCDNCEKSVCQDCLKRFMGADCLEEILEKEDQEWQCFSCDPAPIQRQQAECRQYQVMKAIEESTGRNRGRYVVDLAPYFEGSGRVWKGKKGSHSKTHPKSKEFISDSDDDFDEGGVSGNGKLKADMGRAGEKGEEHSEREGESFKLEGTSGEGEEVNSDRGGGGDNEGSGTNEHKSSEECEMVDEPISSGHEHAGYKGRSPKDEGLGGDNSENADANKSSNRELRHKRTIKDRGEDSSILSLLSYGSDVEVLSDEVSLSDIDMADPSKKAKVSDAEVESTARSGSSSSRPDSDAVDMPTPSKRRSLSLKTRSWHVSRAEFGIEKRGESTSSVSSVEDLGKRSKSKKRVAASRRSWSSYNDSRRERDSMSDDFEATSSSDEIGAKEEAEPDDKEGVVSGEKKKRKKVHKSLFSSDEDSDYKRNLNAILTSSEDELLTLKEHLSESQSANKVKFTLNYASSDSVSDSAFMPSPQKRKRKRIISISSESEEKSHYINLDKESDSDFEERETTHGRNNWLSSRKKKKRVKRSLFSFNNSGGSDSEEEEGEVGIKVKEEENTSNSDKEEDEKTATPGKRKNIRQLISDKKLTTETREAQKAEKERLERLKKRTVQGEEDSGQIILEEDPQTKEIKVQVRPSLVPKILPHQVKGIKFLYNSCCEDVSRLKNEPGSGAILAHCMGLGKTLQVIAFLDALLLSEEDTGIEKLIVMCPVNTLLNWLDEWNKWIPPGIRNYRVTVLNDKGNRSRIARLERWFHMGGVIIMGYEMFRNLSLMKCLKSKKDREAVTKCLLDPGADIVVCDEGHVLRRDQSSLSLAVNKIRTRRRIVLTGTPLQNNLLEYYTMVSFVKPNLLGTLKEFRNRFENPIRNGQHSDSRPIDVRMMKQRAHVLFSLLKGCVDRRDYRILAESLPPKHEYVVAIRMSPVQDKLITRYLEKNSGYHTAQDLFSTFASLSKVWNHPHILELHQERLEDKREREQLDNFINDEEEDDMSGFIVDDDTDGLELLNVTKERERSSRESSTSMDDEGTSRVGDVPKNPQGSRTERSPTPTWYRDLLPEDCAVQMQLSGKMMFLLELLKEVEKIGEKILVFSQSLFVLDMIEEIVQLPECGSMIEGIHYFRLDGSTKADDRRKLMNRFNRKGLESDRLRMFLISTRAGSLGVNLIGANRVVIFDACWNPTHDLQSIFRTYRFGQTKPVFVYRLLAKGTMEEKIYDRQVTKQSLSMRVIDEKQIGRHFSFAQLQELFVYTPPPPPSDTPNKESCEKPDSDIIFCNVLEKLHPQWIVGYHTHDSLLEHIFDEELTEEEQKQAWESYNAQKEVDSRAYNFSLQMQQSSSASAQEGVVSNSSVPNLVASNSHTYTHEAVRLIQIGINKAEEVKGLLTLRNNLARVVMVPTEHAARRRYMVVSQVLANHDQELARLTLRISVVSRDLQMRRSMNPEDMAGFYQVRGAFLKIHQEIENLRSVVVPSPRHLAEAHASTMYSATSIHNRHT